jgi:poly(A) polymerase
LGMSGAELRAVLYRQGRRAVVDALIHRMAQAGGGDQRAQALQRQAIEWPVPRLPVGGKDVARLGQASGPRTGEILKAFEDSWIADDFPSEGHAERLARLVNRPPA